MLDNSKKTEKIHYICQTYVETKTGDGLQVEKQLQYSLEVQAKDRAEREFQREACIGADAYMLTEDAGSGEVSTPTFLVRLGAVPNLEDF